MNFKKITKNKGLAHELMTEGFTLIEVLIVFGIIAILASIVIVAINPARQFAQARNSQRISNINSILNAIGQNMVENKGIFTCTSGNAIIDNTARNIEDLANATDLKTDLRDCIAPIYIPEIPFDPSAGHFTSATDYDTKYTVTKDTTTGRITVCAPGS